MILIGVNCIFLNVFCPLLLPSWDAGEIEKPLIHIYTPRGIVCEHFNILAIIMIIA